MTKLLHNVIIVVLRYEINNRYGVLCKKNKQNIQENEEFVLYKEKTMHSVSGMHGNEM